MIEIIDSQIIRDGVNIGVIDGGTAYVTEKQAPRIVGRIRAAAGNPDLVVSVMSSDVKAEAEKLAEEGVAEVNQQVAESIGVTVEVPDIEAQPEPAKTPSVTTQSLDTTGFPDPKREPAKFRICFVNHYGNDAYNAWQEANA